MDKNDIQVIKHNMKVVFLLSYIILRFILTVENHLFDFPRQLPSVDSVVCSRDLAALPGHEVRGPSPGPGHL